MEYNLTNNDKIIIIKFSDYLYYYKPQIPLFQREFIEERINHFYQKILNYIIKNGNNNIPFLNLIHCVNFDNKYYIVDGQHRFYAYKKYFDIYKNDFNITIAIKDCTTLQEVKDYFIDLNNNFQLHDIILDENDLDKSIIIKSHIKNKYGKCCSNSSTPRYPNINLDQLTKYFLDINKNTTSKGIINKIEELNKDIEQYLKINNNELYEMGLKKQKFYLSYIFMKSENDNKRKRFPKSLRHTLWRSEFQDNMNGYCFVCNCATTIENFHAGHIISVNNGGSDNINNLRVVCSLCNLSMGTQNLSEFKHKYF
jgi:hypothetical protein